MTEELPDLSRDPAAVPVRKRPIPLTVRFAAAGGVCQTREGPVRYAAGDAIVTGTRGERWPVSRETFFSRYRPVPPAVAGEDGTYCSIGLDCWAKQLVSARSVLLSGGERLQAEAGDWLLQYAPGQYGVVSDPIFRETYELRSNRGL